MPIKNAVRLGLVAIVLAALIAGTEGPARAQTYAGGASLTVDDATNAPGEPVTATASGFQPGSMVTFTLAGIEVGTATADADGTATLTFAVPEGLAPGDHTLVASGIDPQGEPLEVTTTITVVAPGQLISTPTDPGSTDAATTGGLARTGAEVYGLLSIGALLVMAGAIAVLTARRGAATRSSRATFGS